LDAAQAEEDQKERDKQHDKDEVTMLTLHGAKGLEYPVVFLVGMEEGFLPHKRTIEEAADFSEERRLCYVGITRARDHLVLTRAKNRVRYGKPVPRYPSRFLADIPKDLLVTTDESLSPDFSSDEKRQEHEVKVKNFLADIRARLQGGGPAAG
jgi:superfamily I DNA/RNA helicase